MDADLFADMAVGDQLLLLGRLFSPIWCSTFNDVNLFNSASSQSLSFQQTCKGCTPLPPPFYRSSLGFILAMCWKMYKGSPESLDDIRDCVERLLDALPVPVWQWPNCVFLNSYLNVFIRDLLRVLYGSCRLVQTEWMDLDAKWLTVSCCVAPDQSKIWSATRAGYIW